MNLFNSSNMLRVGCGLAVVAAIACLLVSVVFATDGDSKPTKKKLTGEELFAINCTRCHAERYATERTKGQWKTVMMHMRVRANLPADQAKVLLKYLQDDCGN